MKKHLSYWRASLIDATKNAPTDSEITSAVHIDENAISSGIVDRDQVERFWQLTDEEIRSGQTRMSVCVAIHCFSVKVNHGEQLTNLSRKTYPLIIIPAFISREGNLEPAENPYVPREFVGPNNDEFWVVTMDRLDAFYTQNITAAKRWEDAFELSKKLFSILNIDEYSDVFITQKGGFVRPWKKAGGAEKSVVQLYDALIKNESGDINSSALAAILSGRKDNLIDNLHAQKNALSQQHVGQMGGEYGLSYSQRMSMLAFLSKNSKVLAINGAPGTGKTTLLQSVVATVWVQAAIEDQDCPIIVGASTNNRAIENIVDAFSKASINIDDELCVKLSGRWIDQVSAFGMNMPSKSAKTKAAENGLSMQLYEGKPTAKNKAVHFASELDDAKVLESASSAFLSKYYEVTGRSPSKDSSGQKELECAREQLCADIKKQISQMQEVVAAMSYLEDEHGTVSMSSAKQWLVSLEEIKQILTHDSVVLNARKLTLTSETEKLAQKMHDFSAKSARYGTEINSTEKQYQSCLGKISAIKKIIKYFLEHRSKESLFVSILAKIGATGKRVLADRLFLMDQAEKLNFERLGLISEPSEASIRECVKLELNDESRVADDIKNRMAELEVLCNEIVTDAISHTRMLDDLHGELNELKVTIKEKEKSIAEVAERIKKVGFAMADWDRLDMPFECAHDDIEAKIDVTFRHRAFLLSVHYWEARFLLSTHAVINGNVTENSSPTNLIAHYRRLAMLCPCFVSSMHKMPGWFSGYKNSLMSPLVGAIDVLIVDEAGQVTPEISAGSFALAKRAVVVGDTNQLEPIWGVLPSIDTLNAFDCKILSESCSYDDFLRSGKSASNGSAMRMAQAASCFTSHQEIGQGMSLIEHRRCLPPIIDYCNKLVYKGALKISTSLKGRPVLSGIPIMGYAHIPGCDQRKNGSRLNTMEASAIAEWLKTKRGDFLKGYGKQVGDELGEIVGIITPFTAQAAEIIKQLNARGMARDKITVGTVNALQGAERELIIYSPVIGAGGSSTFDSKPNMLNVAVSRAKNHFLAFGNMEAMSQNPRSPSGLLAQMLKQENGEIIDVIAQLPRPVKVGLVRSLLNLTNHRQCLIDTFRKAKSQITIVSPYITDKALQSDDVYGEISRARRRGVTVDIMIDDYFSRKSASSSFDSCVAGLREAGATVKVIKPKESGYGRLHSKLLWADGNIFASGSFNWLSSPRYASGDKHEISIVLEGEECVEFIRDAKESLSAAGCAT